MKKKITKKKLICFTLIMSIITSCDHSPKRDSTIDLSHLSSSQLLKIDLKKAANFYPRSAIFDSINYIKLETNSECLIGSIQKLLYIDNKFIIMDGVGSNPILVFDNSGKFLNKIGECGQGPKEYFRPDDIAYDPYNHELIIWSNDDRRIVRYRLDGEFVCSFQLDIWISNIAAYDRDLILAYVNNRKQAYGHAKDYHFLYIDREGTIVSKHDEYDSDIDIFEGVSSRSIMLYNCDVLFNFPCTNNIYKINRDSIDLRYFIDYGKHNIPFGFFIGKNTRDAYSELSRLDVGRVLNFLESETHIFITSLYNSLNINTIFNKQTHQQISYFLFVHNDHYLSFVCPAIVSIVDDQLIGICETDAFQYIKDFYAKLLPDTSEKHIRTLFLQHYRRLPDNDERKQKILNLIERIPFKYHQEDYDFVSEVSSDDNPIIFIGKLRENFNL